MASLSNLSPLLGEYCTLVLEKKALELRIKELDPEVRPLIEGQGALVINDQATIECAIQPGRKTLDKKAVVAAGIDLDPYYKVGAPFTRLTVKEL